MDPYHINMKSKYDHFFFHINMDAIIWIPYLYGKKIAIIWIPYMKKYGIWIWEKNPYLSYLPNSGYYPIIVFLASATNKDFVESSDHSMYKQKLTDETGESVDRSRIRVSNKTSFLNSIVLQIYLMKYR